MNVWGWSSPLGWAVFLFAIGALLALLGWGLYALSKAVERFAAMQNGKK